jgi:hypothetical protein
VNFLWRRGAATPVETAASERQRSLASIHTSSDGLLRVETWKRLPRASARKLRARTTPVFV